MSWNKTWWLFISFLYYGSQKLEEYICNIVKFLSIIASFFPLLSNNNHRSHLKLHQLPYCILQASTTCYYASMYDDMMTGKQTTSTLVLLYSSSSSSVGIGVTGSIWVISFYRIEPFSLASILSNKQLKWVIDYLYTMQPLQE